MSKIGYARISTDDQSLNLQVDALVNAGCDRIFQEIQSGAKRDRPILAECLNSLADGDTLIIWKLDRLGRSLKHLIEIVEFLKEQDVKLLSLTDGIQISKDNPIGELTLNLFGAFAQFERQLIQERCKAGIKAAKERGVKFGRPNLAMYKIQAVDQLLKLGDTIPEACKKVSIGQSTYYRYKSLEKREGL